MVGDWNPKDADKAENVVFDRCFELAEAARELELVASAKGSAGAVSASLGCATSAFESIANSMLMMRGVVLKELANADDPHRDPGADQAVQLGRLLFAIDQNMRFAAQAADLGRENAAEILAEPSPAR